MKKTIFRLASLLIAMTCSIHVWAAGPDGKSKNPDNNDFDPASAQTPKDETVYAHGHLIPFNSTGHTLAQDIMSRLRIMSNLHVDKMSYQEGTHSKFKSPPPSVESVRAAIQHLIARTNKLRNPTVDVEHFSFVPTHIARFQYLKITSAPMQHAGEISQKGYQKSNTSIELDIRFIALTRTEHAVIVTEYQRRSDSSLTRENKQKTYTEKPPTAKPTWQVWNMLDNRMIRNFEHALGISPQPKS